MTTPWQVQLDATLPAATTPADKTAAIQEALDMIPAQPVLRAMTMPHLRIPYGVHELVPDTEGVCLRIKHPTALYLEGSALVVPPETTGLHARPLAQGSLVANGYIIGETHVPIEAAENAGVGVHAQCAFFRAYDLTVTDLGKGLHLDGADGENADFARVSRLVSWRNAVGMHLSTGDCQGGSFDSCIFYQGGIGILNESFLGNHHAGHAFHTTQAEAVLTVWYPADSWNGCFMESDCGVQIGGPDHALVISPYAGGAGGNFLAWMHAGDRIGMGLSSVGFRGSMSDGSSVQVTIPHAGAKSAMEVLRMHPNGAFKEGHRQRWDDIRHLFGWESFTSFSNALGLHMGLAVTNSDHPRGVGHAVHDSTLDAPGELLPKKETA